MQRHPHAAARDGGRLARAEHFLQPHGEDGRCALIVEREARAGGDGEMGRRFGVEALEIGPAKTRLKRRPEIDALELGGAADNVLGGLGWQGGDRRVLAQGLYEVMTTDLRARLPLIEAPVTVVYGWSPDDKSPRSHVDGLFRAGYRSLPHPAAFERIEGAEHMVMIDRPRQFQQAVERFLR